MTAGLVPLFTSAPRLKLQITGSNGESIPVAYAIGFNLNISIDVQPIQVIGQFAAMALEPTLYNVVTGTMQIIRLITNTTKGELVTAADGNANSVIGSASTINTAAGGRERTLLGNAVAASSKADTNSILSQQGLYAHLDPSKVLSSRSFDMDLYLTVPLAGAIGDAATATDGQLSLNGDPIRWLRIKSCRLSSRNTNIAQGQLVNEPVNFQGLLVTPINTVDDNDIFRLDSLVKERL